ncbi:MAG TPA: hypothetical protein VF644_05630 [Pyrinomonadaceae bacterium]|jgi:hypothetical protein
MKTIFILTILIGLSACSVAFKKDSSTESNQAAKKSEEAEPLSAIARKTDEDAEATQTNLTGTYRYKSGRNNNAIGVEELGGNRLEISIVANYEYKDSSGEWMANTGTAGGTVTKTGDTAVFVPEGYPDCEITLKFSGNKIFVKHEGAGGNCGFGGNVTASGTYTKTSNELNQNEMIDDATEIPTKSKTASGGDRIRFAPGKSSTVVSGKISSGDEKTYLVGARAGQTMHVEITEGGANNDVVLYIIAPNGSYPMGMSGETPEYDGFWNGKLGQSGDYKIVLGAIESKNVNFKMSIEIR